MDGPITRNARAHIPDTWDALARSSTYGPELLQQRVDVMKYRMFATVVDQSLEATTYAPTVLDYTGKLIALQVIPAGADYWADQMQSITTTGTSESKSYVDRAAALWRLHANLLREVEVMRTEFESVFGRTARRRVSSPRVNTTGPFVTADPYRFPPFDQAGASRGLLPWDPVDRWSLS